ncbi:MAG: helix-turn-helix transcriptional regulator, partial [Ilumatobacteraceae bacterium]
MGTTVGDLLREWRVMRRLSQLDLATVAEVSTRHLSCVENARARPSRELILHLARFLDVPMRDRNKLLLAAGFAPVYPEHSWNEEELDVVREGIQWVLRSHEPYPATVVDRHWNLIEANRASTVLIDGVAPWLTAEPINLMRVAMHPDGLAERVVNFAQWSSLVLQQLRRQITATDDRFLLDLYDELVGYPNVVAHAATADTRASSVLIPLRLLVDGVELAFFNTVGTFWTAQDVTVAELILETYFPA